MIIVALRLAGNVESPLAAVQDMLFRRDSLASTRLFPPLIPVAIVNPAPLSGATASGMVAALERVRRATPVVLSPGEKQTLQAGETGISCSDAGFEVELSGFSVLQRVVADEVAALFGSSAVTIPKKSRVVLAWQGNVGSDVQVPPLRGTRALWLAGYVIWTPGPPERPWWDGASWEEFFNRRLTVRDLPPPGR